MGIVSEQAVGSGEDILRGHNAASAGPEPVLWFGDQHPAHPGIFVGLNYNTWKSVI